MTQSAQTLRKKNNCTIIHLIPKVVTYLLSSAFPSLGYYDGNQG